MSFPAYDKYFDSQNPWITEVPEHWNSCLIDRFVEEKCVRNTGLAQTNLLSLSFGSIVRRDINTADGLLPASFETYQLVEPDDIVFRPTDLQNDWNSLRSAIVVETGIITSAYIAVRPVGVDPQFLNYLFRSYDHSKVFYSLGGGLRQSFKFGDIKRLPIFVPPLPEQTAIAAFLDTETSKIDDLVTEQRRLIELLKEKRQAVISHAVTKGLNPDVKMKDSGIQWLGDVPEHWEVASLKHYVSTANGFGFSSSDFQDDGVPFIRAGDIKNKSIRPPTIFLPKEVVANYERVILTAGDIVISMVGSDPKIIESAVGQVGIIPEHLAGAVPNQNIVIMRESSDFILSRYLFYTLCSTAYRNHLNVFSHKLANQSIISSSLLIAATFTFPHKKEQQAIVDVLDETVAATNQLIAQAERAIKLLQERRTALISAAVTGKIDVRGYVAEEVAA